MDQSHCCSLSFHFGPPVSDSGSPPPSSSSPVSAPWQPGSLRGAGIGMTVSQLLLTGAPAAEEHSADRRVGRRHTMDKDPGDCGLLLQWAWTHGHRDSSCRVYWSLHRTPIHARDCSAIKPRQTDKNTWLLFKGPRAMKTAEGRQSFSRTS